MSIRKVADISQAIIKLYKKRKSSSLYHRLEVLAYRLLDSGGNLPPDSSFSIVPDVYRKHHEAMNASCKKLKDTNLSEKYLTITALVNRAKKGDQGAIDALRNILHFNS